MKKLMLSTILGLSIGLAIAPAYADPVTGNADSTTYRLSGGIAPSSGSDSGGAFGDYEGKSAYAYGQLGMAGSPVVKHNEVFAKFVGGAPYVRTRSWSTGCSGCVVYDTGYIQSFYVKATDTIAELNVVNGVLAVKAFILANAKAGDTRGFVLVGSSNAFTK